MWESLVEYTLTFASKSNSFMLHPFCIYFATCDLVPHKAERIIGIWGFWKDICVRWDSTGPLTSLKKLSATQSGNPWIERCFSCKCRLIGDVPAAHCAVAKCWQHARAAVFISPRWKPTQRSVVKATQRKCCWLIYWPHSVDEHSESLLLISHLIKEWETECTT